jgi:hypothetical protein
MKGREAVSNELHRIATRLRELATDFKRKPRGTFEVEHIRDCGRLLKRAVDGGGMKDDLKLIGLRDDIGASNSPVNAWAVAAKWLARNSDISSKCGSFMTVDDVLVREDYEWIARSIHAMADLIGREAKPDADLGTRQESKPSDSRFTAAYASYELAQKALRQSLDREPTDAEAYEWLKEYGPADYDLPDFVTWQRYLRVVRHERGTQKNQPRAGRDGRSIVKAAQIEAQQAE